MVINVEELLNNPHAFRFWINYLIGLGIKAGWSMEKIDKELDKRIEAWVAEYKRIKSQAASNG